MKAAVLQPRVKYSVYNRQRDGNVFDWILKQAQQMRDKRNG